MKTLKHEKVMFSFGFQWFSKVQRWLKAMKMSIFGYDHFAVLLLEVPFDSALNVLLEPLLT